MIGTSTTPVHGPPPEWADDYSDRWLIGDAAAWTAGLVAAIRGARPETVERALRELIRLAGIEVPEGGGR
jgi:hypothetical protein